MPLVSAAVASIAAGLLLGFGGGVAFGLLLALAGGAAAIHRRDAVPLALAALLCAGMGLARGARASDAACARRVESAGRARIVLAESVSVGGHATGVMHARGCRVRATVFVAEGEARAGASVVAEGAASAGERGILVRDAAVTELDAPSLAARMRSAAARAIDRTFGTDAPAVRALVIADQRALDREVRARFADAGIVHLLSVSGMHVAIVSAALELLLLAMRISRRGAAVAGLGLTFGYVVVIGAPPPAVRAAVMLGASQASRLLQRPTSPWAVLSLGAVVPLRDPRAVLDLGWQLSVAGMAALIASGELSRRLLGDAKGWRRSLATAMLASVVASLVTLPLVSWYFARVSIVSPIANAVVGPLFAVLQPALFLGLVLSPIPALASPIAAVCHLLLALVDRVGTVASQVPLAAVTFAPTHAESLALGAAAVLLVVACVARFPTRPAIACASLVALAAWMPQLPGPDGREAELHLLDVGQGDAALMRTPAGRWIVFDAGRTWQGGDAGRSVVAPYIRRRGGRVAAFVLSHPHADHVGGAASVVRLLRPAAFWDAGYVGPSGPYADALEAAREVRVPWRRARPGDTLALDGVTIRFLAPDSAWATALDDPNDASTVALVEFGRTRFLLVGDAERGEEEWLLGRWGDSLRADVLKVGHHGSSTSSTAPFLDAVRPRIALVSVGQGNRYGHPSADVLDALRERGALVMRTDEHGAIVVSTDGRTLRVSAGGATWAF